MNWTEQNPNGISRLESSSTEMNKIISDLKIVLSDTKEKLSHSQIENIYEILIYVDATNGNIFCCGYDSKREKVFDDKGSDLELNEFWEFCSDSEGGAMEFDSIIEESVNNLMESDFGKGLANDFDIYLQDELESPKRIKTLHNKELS